MPPPRPIPHARALLAHWRANATAWDEATPAIRKATGLRVWNPGRYGDAVYARFVARYSPPGRGAFATFGLNPGKYGMAQTGLPFTDVFAARELLPALAFDLPAPALAPASLRPFLLPTNRERSSQSVYGFFELAHGSAEEGWKEWWCGVPCPLLFLTPTGDNVTPAHSVLARLPVVRELRERAIADGLRVAKPRAVALFGTDVAKLGLGLVEDAVGAENVLVMDHPVARGPGRRGPAWWAETFATRLRDRGFLPAP